MKDDVKVFNRNAEQLKIDKRIKNLVILRLKMDREDDSLLMGEA